MQFASLAVNEFLARLHPYRDDANKHFATYRLSLTQVYEGLPQAKQDCLQEEARTNLLQRGIKKEFLLDAVVKGEVLRLLEQGDAELAQ